MKIKFKHIQGVVEWLEDPKLILDLILLYREYTEQIMEIVSKRFPPQVVDNIRAGLAFR